MIDESALKKASEKLRKLRLTDVGGRKEHPDETVKSVLEKGLGGMYDDDAVTYILRFGIKYYLAALSEKSQAKCTYVGCNNIAVFNGFCEEHKHRYYATEES